MIPLGILGAAATAGSGGGSPTFAAEVAADSPWAWWKLDEDTDDIGAADASGNGRNLSNNGIGAANRMKTPLTSDGGYSMLFAGDSIAGTPPGFSGHTALAFEVMVKATSLSAARVLLHNGDIGIPGQQGQFLAINTSGGIYFQAFTPSGTMVRASDNGAIAANEAAIIGVSHDSVADQVVIYKNGTAIKTIPHTEGLAGTANANWTIGDLKGSSAPHAGYLDHVLVFNSALSAARFLAHAQAAGFA